MKIKKKFGDKIFIEWLDAYTTDGWTSFEKAMELSGNCLCKTNALFVGQTEDFVVVSHTQGRTKDNSLMGVLNIPKKWIKIVR